MSATDGTKRCSLCGEVKPLDGFHRQASSKDGHQRICKPCRTEHQRAWYRAKVAQAESGGVAL